ncbi:hypothetical protein [Streptomyces xiaopingdaonensis]|uniref:hypothetical protein n=1 Tax=Streptomyces xiaopingdaonensis TaxID=1565415 RepID=UPI00030896EA|nr:hypothetical protein [Streptomyces xiaopingdaonensis]
MTGIEQLAPKAPTSGAIASLSVRPWVDRINDHGFAPMLITHPRPHRDTDTAAVIESCMLGIARALGTAPAHATLPDAGERIAVHNGVVLLRLDGTPHVLTTRAGNWGRVITEIGHVLLAVGLDPLSTAANGAEVNEYITASVKANRLYFAAASVAVSARWIRAAEAVRP